MAQKRARLICTILATGLALSACDDSPESESSAGQQASTTASQAAKTTAEPEKQTAPASPATAPQPAEATDAAAAAEPAKAGETEKPSAAERAGLGDFDATGKVPCAAAAGQPLGQCDMGVARDGGGTATVIVTTPDGRKRALFFEGGKFLSADISQADGDITASATKEGDLFKIQVGEERYEIPEVVIFGD